MEIRNDYSDHRAAEQQGTKVHIKGNEFIPGVSIDTDTTVAVIGTREPIFRAPDVIEQTGVAIVVAKPVEIVAKENPIDEVQAEIQREFMQSNMGSEEDRMAMARFRVMERRRATPMVGA